MDNSSNKSFRNDKTGGYIRNITFNDGSSVEINKNDIVVFVGPNNSGKSQSLKDIYTLCESKVPTVIVSDIVITKKEKPIISFLDSLGCPITDRGSYKSYQTMEGVINVNRFTDKEYATESAFGKFRKLFVVNLDTAARLNICQPAENIRRNQEKNHPIHYAAFNSEYRKWLSENFQKAFGIEITPNIHYGSHIPLCLGGSVKLEGDYSDEQERLEEYAEILALYEQVQNQGDGIKSFTGILLYLMIDYYCTYMIDEPESFLHPPQANIMGRIIGETVSDEQQVFISTHSEEIIKGLLSACPDRIKVIRITRQGNVNHFSVLDNKKFSEIWNDPLLKHSNIMSSLFHKTVVLCESDSDCKFYSIVNDGLKKEEGTYSETLFIHCSGKHRMARITKALKSLNVDVKLIPDIDVFNDRTVFQQIIEAYGIKWEDIETKYNIFVSNLQSHKEQINRLDFKTEVDRIIGASQRQILTKNEVNEISKALKTVSKWEKLKESGFNAVPRGDAYNAVKEMNTILEEHGIFVVPVGELECFIKEVGRHGPDWVNTVLENYPDLNDPIYDDAKEFIKKLKL